MNVVAIHNTLGPTMPPKVVRWPRLNLQVSHCRITRKLPARHALQETDWNWSRHCQTDGRTDWWACSGACSARWFDLLASEQETRYKMKRKREESCESRWTGCSGRHRCQLVCEKSLLHALASRQHVAQLLRSTELTTTPERRTSYIVCISFNSVYPAKCRPGSQTTKLDSGAQKRLIRSPFEGYGPRPQARARLARAAIVPQASAQASARTRTAGHCARQHASPVGTFSKSAILQRFPNLYTLRVEIFRMLFIRSRLPMTSMNDEKFHGNRSARFWAIRKTDRQTHFFHCCLFCGN